MELKISKVRVRGRGVDKTFWITFEGRNVRQTTLVVNAKDVAENYLAAYPTECPSCGGKRQTLHRCTRCQSVWESES